MLSASTLVAQRYRVVRSVYVTGRNVLYLVEDLKLNRHWFLRAFHQVEKDVRGEDRFRQEAWSTVRLDHANLARVLDFFEDDGLPLMLLDYVEGKTLKEIAELAPRPLSDKRVRGWAAQLLDVLQYLHEQGLNAHGLNPSSIILGPDNRLRLLDYGLGREPEVARDLDIQGLGETLFLLLTKQLPPRSAMEILGQTLASNASVSPATRALVESLLTPRSPTYTIAELREMLQASPGRSTSPHRFVAPGADLEQAVVGLSGGAVTLGAGIHRLRRPLSLPPGIQLKGAGADVTELVCASPGSVLVLKGGGVWRLEGLTVCHAGSEEADVIRLLGGSASFQGCRFTGAVGEALRGSGLHLAGNASAQVADCESSSNQNGIAVTGQADCTVVDCLFHSNRGSGISFGEHASGGVRQSKCFRNHLDGIRVAAKAQAILEGNWCFANRHAGISFLGDAAGTARKNVCRGNGTGIVVGKAASPALINNRCLENDEAEVGYRGRSATPVPPPPTANESRQAEAALAALRQLASRQALEPAASYQQSLAAALQQLRGTSGICQLPPGVPTVIVPDIHARRELILKALELRLPLPRGNVQLFEALCAGQANLLCLGDGPHSEGRAADRWRRVSDLVCAMKKDEALQLLTEEMVEGLGTMKMVWDLKVLFPDRFHYLRGNHDEVMGNYAKYAPFGEARLVCLWLRNQMGQEFLEQYALFEECLPLMAQGAALVASHAVPGRSLTREAIAARHREAFMALSWTDNSYRDARGLYSWETQENRDIVNSLLSELGAPGALWFVGHRHVEKNENGGRFRGHFGGRLLQINCEQDLVVAVVPAEASAFQAERDIFFLQP